MEKSCSGKRKKKMATKCKICTQTVRANQRGLECDGCKFWWHIKCSKTSESYFNLVNNKEPNMEGVKWFCSTCLPMLSQFDQIKIMQGKLDDKMNGLEKLMERLEKKRQNLTRE